MKIIKKENIKKKFEILTKFFLYRGVKQCCQYLLLSEIPRVRRGSFHSLLCSDIKQCAGGQNLKFLK